MKLTMIRTDLKNQMHMSVKNLESFVERMKTETKNQEVSHLREHLRQGYPSHSYALIHKMTRVHPLAELRRDANGNLTMVRLHGLVMLNIRGRPARRAGKPHQLRAHACQHRGHA